MAVNPMDPSGKDTVLEVVRNERGKFYNVIDDPANWNVQTRAEKWEVRDMVSHMIDVTEGYLTGWDKARNGEDPIDAVGTGVMRGAALAPLSATQSRRHPATANQSPLLDRKCHLSRRGRMAAAYGVTAEYRPNQCHEPANCVDGRWPIGGLLE